MSFSEEIKSNKYVHDVLAHHENPCKITEAMLNERGDLRPFYSFYREVGPFIGEHDKEQLKDEFDLAIRRAHLARDIRQFLQDADVLPNLRWVPSTHPDGCKRHEQFFNRIWAINDRFWLDNMPLDGTDCSCYLSSTDDSTTYRTQKTSVQPWEIMISNTASRETLDENQSSGVAFDDSAMIDSLTRVMLEQCDGSITSWDEARRLVVEALAFNK